jgi:hypothetical protein
MILLIVLFSLTLLGKTLEELAQEHPTGAPFAL